MLKYTRLAVLGFFFALVFPALSHAGEPRQIGTYGDWSVYVFIEDGQKVCYMLSTPKNMEGEYKKRGDVYVMVTNRPSENAKNVFSYMAGYSYKPSSDATALVDSNKFTLFTKDETAWAPDSAGDEKIIGALRKGSKLVVKGVSARGTATTDTFGLKGSSQAHDVIMKECGMN